MSLIKVCISDDFEVDYDKERGMYRVSVFDDGHFWDEFWFDAYEEKEFDNFFPQTIGDITYYSKAELFEWVENQQKLNKILIQEGCLKTINTCSEKWYVKNHNLNKGIEGVITCISDYISTLEPSKEEKVLRGKIEKNFDVLARCKAYTNEE